MNTQEYIEHNCDKECECVDCLKYNISSLKLEIEIWKQKNKIDNKVLLDMNSKLQVSVAIKQSNITNFLYKFPQYYDYFKEIATN